MCCKISFLFLFLFSALCFAETTVITDCDDISLIKSAYANDKGIHSYEDATKDSLVMNSWRC